MCSALGCSLSQASAWQASTAVLKPSLELASGPWRPCHPSGPGRRWDSVWVASSPGGCLVESVRKGKQSSPAGDDRPDRTPPSSKSPRSYPGSGGPCSVGLAATWPWELVQVCYGLPSSSSSHHHLISFPIALHLLLKVVILGFLPPPLAFFPNVSKEVFQIINASFVAQLYRISSGL